MWTFFLRNVIRWKKGKLGLDYWGAATNIFWSGKLFVGGNEQASRVFALFVHLPLTRFISVLQAWGRFFLFFFLRNLTWVSVPTKQKTNKVFFFLLWEASFLLSTDVIRGGRGGRGRSPLRKLCKINSFCHFLAYSGHNLQGTTPK